MNFQRFHRIELRLMPNQPEKKGKYNQNLIKFTKISKTIECVCIHMPIIIHICCLSEYIFAEQKHITWLKKKTSFSRHNGGPIKDPLKILGTIVLWCTTGFSEALSLNQSPMMPRDASLFVLAKLFRVWHTHMNNKCAPKCLHPRNIKEIFMWGTSSKFFRNGILLIRRPWYSRHDWEIQLRAHLKPVGTMVLWCSRDCRGLLIEPLWCREAPAFQTAVRLIAALVPVVGILSQSCKGNFTWNIFIFNSFA